MIVPTGYRSLADAVDTVLASGRPDEIEHALLMLRRMVYVDDDTFIFLEHCEQRLEDALNPPTKKDLLERLVKMQLEDAWMQGLNSWQS